ncbi:MAG: NAD-dependent epimerase/dehydratase family protein [Flavobacterium sp.]|nr:NAD-dependent epimerase/dehydratase family protein [Flavobacterium sp.]
MVLVTGGTGFLGSHLLIHLLENEENVRAIYRNKSKIAKVKLLFSAAEKSDLFEKIEWIKADILDVSALEIAFQGIDYVYHCAGLVSFNPKDENLLRKINIEGTANIVNFCLANKVKKICHVSSIAALGDLLDYENTITETTEWNPEKNHSDYAISKYGGEIEVWRAQQEGLDCVVVNPGIILGFTTNWNEGSGKIFKTIFAGLQFYTKGTTGFVAVNDVAKIMFQLMKSNFKNEKYILVAENMVFQNFLNLIADGLQVKRPALNAKKWLLTFLWRSDWILCNLFFQRIKFSKLTAKSLLSPDIYDNQKIKTAINYKFEAIDNCIIKTCDYFLQQLKK